MTWPKRVEPIGVVKLNLMRTREKLRSQKKKSNVDCYNYGKHGHYTRDCWVEKNRRQTQLHRGS
jgi:hypothetical protein